MYRIRTPISVLPADTKTIFEDVGSSGAWTPSAIMPLIRLNVNDDLWGGDLEARAIQIVGHSAITSVEGGTAPYEYLWSIGDTTSFAENLPKYVWHYVTVTDVNNCKANSKIWLINGIEENEFEGDVPLHPNPNNG
jgi:hypothetical protein